MAKLIGIGHWALFGHPTPHLYPSPFPSRNHPAGFHRGSPFRRLSFAQDSNQTLLPLIPEYAVQTLTPQEMLQVEQRMDQRRERLRDKCSAYGLDVLGGSASGLGSPRISIPNLNYRSRLVAHPEHVGVSGQQKVSHYLVGVNFIHFPMNPF